MCSSSHPRESHKFEIELKFEKNAATSVGAFAKSADASRSLCLTHCGGAYSGAEIVSSSGDAAGMPHKRQLIAPEMVPAVTKTADPRRVFWECWCRVLVKKRRQ